MILPNINIAHFVNVDLFVNNVYTRFSLLSKYF
jgi:hypothetical protein